MVLSDIDISFQTKLQTLFEDLGWNKYVTNNVSMNASVAPIHLKLFFFSIVFKGGSFFLPQHCEHFFYSSWLYCFLVWYLEIGWYLFFTDISVSAETANFFGLSRCWQNVVIFLTHPGNSRKKTQLSKSRQLSCSNASRCGFINKQTRLAMENASAIAAETKASLGSFAMLEATTRRCCVRINSHCTSGSFCSMKSLTGT